jgi:hypothetical protein
MEDALLKIFHVAVKVAKLLGPGGVRAVVAENFLLKHHQIILRRPRQRAANLTVWDRFLFGFGSICLWPRRIRNVAIELQLSTLLKLHHTLVRRTYRRRQFSLSHWPKTPGPRGPSDDLIRIIVALNSRNPRFGTARWAFLDPLLLLNRRDLEQRLSGSQACYDMKRIYASLDGKTPSGVAVGETARRVKFQDVCWVPRCRGVVRLPMAAWRRIRAGQVEAPGCSVCRGCSRIALPIRLVPVTECA